MSHKSACFFVALACATTLAAQDNPISADTKGFYTSVKNNIIKSADKMSEANFSFKPTPDVRTFAQVLGHIADGQYLFCGPVRGEEKKSEVEKGPQTKAAIVEALKAAFAYCDAAYDKLTDATAAEKVKFFGRDRTKVGVLSINSGHNNEHYGNLVTYMRLKGIVPPSSEGR